MSCHLNGASEFRADLQHRFAKSGPADVLIRDVSCLGRCDQAPAVSINDEIFSNVTAAAVESIARSASLDEEVLEPHPEHPRVQCASDPYGDGEKYGVV